MGWLTLLEILPQAPPPPAEGARGRRLPRCGDCPVGGHPPHGGRPGEGAARGAVAPRRAGFPARVGRCLECANAKGTKVVVIQNISISCMNFLLKNLKKNLPSFSP